jgi:hypothetical protein
MMFTRAHGAPTGCGPEEVILGPSRARRPIAGGIPTTARTSFEQDLGGWTVAGRARRGPASRP